MGSIGPKIKGKFIQNALNLLNNIFGWKFRATLGPSISGTKCDRDKPIFFCRKRGSIGLCCGIKWGSNRIRNPQNGGVITAEPYYHAQLLGVHPSPRDPRLRTRFRYAVCITVWEVVTLVSPRVGHPQVSDKSNYFLHNSDIINGRNIWGSLTVKGHGRMVLT